MLNLFSNPEKKRQQIVNQLPAPNCQLAEALYLLLDDGGLGVTRRHAMLKAWILNYPVCIHLLRDRGAVIKTEMVDHTNKFGRGVSYGKYKLSPDHFDFHVGLYKRIVSDNTKDPK